MYEFELINETLIKQYAEAMNGMLKQENPYPIVFSVVKRSFKALVPNTADHIIKPYVKSILSPLYELLKNKYNLRKFESEEEAKTLYNEAEKVYRSKILDNEIIDEFANFFYDLLEYDLCIEENEAQFLHSYSTIFNMSRSHIQAVIKWNKLFRKKPDEENFDIAVNTQTSRKKMIAFKLNAIERDLLHDNVFEKESLMSQREILQDFITHNHLTVRFIAELRKYVHSLPHDNMTTSNLKLSHILNADRPIDKMWIYQSFFTVIIGIYKKSCAIHKKKVPYKKLYTFADKLTKFVFPELANLKKPLFTYDKIQKPIKEIAIFDGLRLISFEDNRFTIHKEQDEIDLTEQYFKNIIKFSKRYTLSKS
ncbi:hypothetical protein [Sulfurospirillum diekertiae]|uniref:Uncharacterized protein n=1 Tax=Sulfurospirillum diekertiae TaxID=1854492 RepID=A0AA92FFR8_9BACT|nr:hypothetical protein [Sulfurospirillum diekertiae]QIR74749.1 hypothetical protein FA584_00345 [Sulfurospirillum diekertiae]